MTADRLSVVFDCNVFVQMMLNPIGIAARCKRFVDSGEVTLFISAAIFAEVSEVLKRPRFQALSPSITAERIDAFLEAIVDLAVPVMNVPEEFHFERDPKDEPYLNLAIVTRADYIVSYDKDLLDLMSKATEQGREFRRRYPTLSLVEPLEFLKKVAIQS